MTSDSIDLKSAKEKLDDIYKLVINEINVATNNPSNLKMGLYDGKIGIAVFLYEYAQYKKISQNECSFAISQIVEETFNFIKETKNLPRSLCNGLTGILCALNYFQNEGILNLEDDYIPKEIIDFLENGSINDTIQYNNCDLLHGGLGFLSYLIENQKISNWKELINNQLDVLKKISIPIAPNMINWRLNSEYLKFHTLNEDKNGINLGLAHGISGIIILLAKLKQKHSSKYVDDGIEKGMNLILSTRLKNTKSTSLYPTAVIDNKPELNSRLAWCYGDLCIALAAWHSWEATKNENYKNVSLEIIDHAIKTTPQNAYVTDCGICHGTAGISLIFRKFYWATYNEEYKKAANFWINQTLDMANQKGGYAGYKAFKSIEYGGSTNELGLLEGVSGIGLALISAITNKQNKWDKLFLIS